MGPWLLIHMQTYSLSRVLLPARWCLRELRVQVSSPFGSHQPSDRFCCLSRVLTRRKDRIPFHLEPTNILFLLLTEWLTQHKDADTHTPICLFYLPQVWGIFLVWEGENVLSYPEQAFCPSFSISLRAPAFGTQKVKDSLLSSPFHKVTTFLWDNEHRMT